MRNLSLILIFTACVAQPPSRASESGDEEAAILETIRGETAAFWEKDFDKWAASWSHESYVRLVGWWEAGSVYWAEGWETVGGNMKELMDENPEPNPTSGAVRRENINMRISGTMAMVTFDQYGLDTGDAAMDMPGLSRETRVLEKHDGRWKIIYVGFLLEGESAR